MECRIYCHRMPPSSTRRVNFKKPKDDRWLDALNVDCEGNLMRKSRRSKAAVQLPTSPDYSTQSTSSAALESKTEQSKDENVENLTRKTLKKKDKRTVATTNSGSESQTGTHDLLQHIDLSKGLGYNAELHSSIPSTTSEALGPKTVQSMEQNKENLTEKRQKKKKKQNVANVDCGSESQTEIQDSSFQIITPIVKTVRHDVQIHASTTSISSVTVKSKIDELSDKNADSSMGKPLKKIKKRDVPNVDIGSGSQAEIQDSSHCADFSQASDTLGPKILQSREKNEENFSGKRHKKKKKRNVENVDSGSGSQTEVQDSSHHEDLSQASEALGPKTMQSREENEENLSGQRHKKKKKRNIENVDGGLESQTEVQDSSHHEYLSQASEALGPKTMQSREENEENLSGQRHKKKKKRNIENVDGGLESQTEVQDSSHHEYLSQASEALEPKTMQSREENEENLSGQRCKKKKKRNIENVDGGSESQTEMQDSSHHNDPSEENDIDCDSQTVVKKHRPTVKETKILEPINKKTILKRFQEKLPRGKSPEHNEGTSARRCGSSTDTEGISAPDEDSMTQEGAGSSTPMDSAKSVVKSLQEYFSNSPKNNAESSKPTAVTIENIGTMLAEILAKIDEKKPTTSLPRPSTSGSQRERPPTPGTSGVLRTRTTSSGDVEVEIQPGSGVYVDKIELKFNILRLHTSPKEMIRRLLLYLVGREKLKNMTACGLTTKPRGNETGKKKRIKRSAIPSKILEAIKYYVDRKSTPMSWPDFNRVVNLKCGTLRNPKKAKKDGVATEEVNDEVTDDAAEESDDSVAD